MSSNGYAEDRNKKSKILGGILIAVIIILIVTLAFIGYKMLNPKKESPEVEQQTEQKVLSGSGQKSNSTGGELSSIETSSKSKAKKKLEDYEIIGAIEIPKTGLKCDILNEVTKRSIEIAVATIYSTGGLNQPGNTVIYGHNYRNSLFFSKNDELSVGDKIYITDEEGNKKTYKIYDKFETTSTDTSFYTKTAEMTGGKAEVTLSTCTDDANQTDRRLIILASAEE